MRGDIIQDQTGWFFRDNGNGTLDSLSAKGSPTVTTKAIKGQSVVLVRDNTPTGNGDRLAARVAVTLARRYTTAS